MKALGILAALLAMQLAAPASLPLLKISENKRFIVTAEGKPFFWLGDTAWEIFHRLNREESVRYLDDRAGKGFNVIQAVAIGEFGGDTIPNVYGHLPLNNLDPEQPATHDGTNNDYWDHVDFIVNEANKRGLYIGFLPTWGRYWHDAIKDGKPIFTPSNAETYGKWLGRRYENAGIIWILGGDRSVENDGQRETIQAMARGLRAGDHGAHLITFHPSGGSGSSRWFQNEQWLDLNLRQNGHGLEYTGHFDQTRADYDRTPIKPVIDGEPIYEDHPISFDANHFGHSTAADVRRAFYWDVFGGACGHTYGDHAIWQFYDPARQPAVNNPLLPWTEALNDPGASQMQYGSKLIESRPFLTRIPDDSVIVIDRVPTSVPGAGTRHFSATRDTDRTYAMIYAPLGRAFKIHMDALAGSRSRAWWFNPRNGKATDAGEFKNEGEHEFTPPDKGELLDWILVLDDVAKNYLPPGS